MTDRDVGLVLGPRTTVFEVLVAYPFLTQWLPRYHDAFWRLTSARGRVAWARIATLGEVAVEMDVTWRMLVRDISDEVVRVTGRQPPAMRTARTVAADDPRVVELQEMSLQLENGASLLELACRLSATTEGADTSDDAALDAALNATVRKASASVARGLLETVDRQTDAALSGSFPEGHPLDSLRREGAQIVTLSASLRAELERLGGSPSRRRWRTARPLLARLTERLSGVELRVRREQQAWLPALAVVDAEGVAILLRDKHTAALESLRLLRLAVTRDDPVPVIEHGTRLLDCLTELSAAEEHVLAPVAERSLSEADWAAVRELEDGVGWSLIPSPPPWPPV